MDTNYHDTAIIDADITEFSTLDVAEILALSVFVEEEVKTA